jgi:predicted dehydrogenase
VTPADHPLRWWPPAYYEFQMHRRGRGTAKIHFTSLPCCGRMTAQTRNLLKRSMKKSSSPHTTELISSSRSTRREFLATSGKLVAASALAGVALPHVHAAEDNTIRLAIVGCGGRGTGAVGNACDAQGGPVKLVAMADLFEPKMTRSLTVLMQNYGRFMDVPPSRRFLGFDAYRKAIDCLRPGDVLLQTTHAAFRAEHIAYAIEKGVHVFMEKSFAADPAGIKRLLELAERADRKNIKIACGIMCRHSSARQALINRIRDGAMGDIQLIRAYRMGGGYRLGPRPEGGNELLWQVAHAGHFFWASAGLLSELMIHQIDECCWIKDGWPVSAHGLGGRAPNNRDEGQNLDTYAIEYTFADGAKAVVNGRYIPHTQDDFSTYIHGTKCAAQFSGNIHAPTTHLYKDQRTENGNIAWRPPKETVSPYVAEWSALLTAIRNNRPHNELKRSAYSNLAVIMGRAAVHSGKTITWDEALASDFRFCPSVDFTNESPAPVRADAAGRYPVPVPGAWTEI